MPHNTSQISQKACKKMLHRCNNRLSTTCLKMTCNEIFHELQQNASKTVQMACNKMRHKCLATKCVTNDFQNNASQTVQIARNKMRHKWCATKCVTNVAKVRNKLRNKCHKWFATKCVTNVTNGLQQNASQMAQMVYNKIRHKFQKLLATIAPQISQMSQKVRNKILHKCH